MHPQTMHMRDMCSHMLPADGFRWLWQRRDGNSLLVYSRKVRTRGNRIEC